MFPSRDIINRRGCITFLTYKTAGNHCLECFDWLIFLLVKLAMSRMHLLMQRNSHFQRGTDVCFLGNLYALVNAVARISKTWKRKKCHASASRKLIFRCICTNCGGYWMEDFSFAACYAEHI